jgi:hypothetical protein
LKKLDSKRADDDESFKEVAIAMHAVDRLLGTDESNTQADLGLGNEVLITLSYVLLCFLPYCDELNRRKHKRRLRSL